MISKLLARILGTDNERQLRLLQPIVSKINTYASALSVLTDEQLGAKTNEFRKQLSQGKSLDDILPEAFAVVREVSKRKLGQRHYDVQLLGGIVLHQGKIAEMKTGEGKTLTATLPLYLNALAGKGAHLVTVNDYLASRDAEWMSPIYETLGLTVSCLSHTMDDQQRKDAYNSDILYATNNELGFDYLRDNMKHRLEDYVQREMHYAIVDEVDSILIDEARTPLIISGAADKSSRLYIDANAAVKRLQKDTDYEVNEKDRSVLLTESGNDKLEHMFNVSNMYAIENITLLHHITQALKAHALFRRDVDYVVRDNQVLIVDEFTGRILPGRRYSDGLHQALEAKEGAEIERESQTLASITLQNYFRMYSKLAGMTGTAMTETEEFYKIYKLRVIAVPTNCPLIRKDQGDLIFLTKNAKYKAIVEDLKERYAKKQPVLIGTVAIETSELLSSILSANGIPHDVLNAKQHEREADIVARAGEPGHITIATNMAGRGTDIKLTPESIDAGGLYILGTERHESRRIDNQLRGRAGRQGDPGESRFYLSLEDDLIRVFSGSGDKIKNRMQMVGMEEDEVLEHRWITKIIASSQEKVEKGNFDRRKHLLEYDDVLNQQRKVIYDYRRQVLEGEEHVYDLVRDLLIASVQDGIAYFCPQRTATQEQLTQFAEFLHTMTGLSKTDIDRLVENKLTTEVLEKDVINYILEQYELFRKRQDVTSILSAEKWLLLETIDQAWKQHMLNLDHLKEGISLRSWGQKNPLIEYKKEAFVMFKDTMTSIRRDVVHHLFHLKIERFDEHALEQKRQQELDELQLGSSKAEAGAPQERSASKVGRNDPCECGSGKKYKKCCGK